MPQTNAAKKALRVSERNRVINERWRQHVRTVIRDMKDALSSGPKEKAKEVLVKFQSVLDRATKHNILHPNRAARLKSRASAAVAKRA